ncbi:hypothetical protein PG996_009318 [Apiospora saccharicola]|uniref:Thioesterase domain-containing protein n=1 Tax=Apiospora saccharicola TaxID=335842 RepID=A0ABR1UNB9_9PEZI
MADDKFALQDAVKPYSASKDHNQSVPDPVEHFKAIPWCRALIEDKANLDILVPDRRPLDSGESNFVRRTMNTPTTIKACITFFRPVRAHPKLGATAGSDVSKSKELLSGGGPENSENPKNPFLLFSALVDLGVDCQSYAGTMHGGLYGVLMDELPLPPFVILGQASVNDVHDVDLTTSALANGAYTVRFTTNMRRPVRTPQIVLVRGRVIKREGRKLHVRGSMEDKNGEVLAEADGLWLCMAENVGRSVL